MIQKSKLENSLKYFTVAVERLHERPLLEEDLSGENLSEEELSARYFLERALDANIASSRALGEIELIEEESKDREDCFEYGVEYNKLIRLCLREFQEMMPRLNGQAWHVDLYCEQMRGRIELINRIYSHRN